jgi:ADP-L-glycero-D-manno-heptose 6-epimerase
MIVITGAAGFIGSCLVRAFNDAGRKDLVLVDDFSKTEKAANLANKQFAKKVERDVFVGWLGQHADEVEAVLHIGARTDTTEQDKGIFDVLNVNYTKLLWTICRDQQLPFYYASSAATYGLGEHGYADDHETIPALKPLNPYGQSKQDFDVWALEEIAAGNGAPPHWAGFKFFNVYGPNEYHKARMASVIFHTARQIKATGAMKLFRSHRPDYKDGEQSRDFIYVKDVCAVLMHFFENQPPNGIYNLGTGQARSFYDLAANTFRSMGLEPQISFIDTPEDIRDTYQYFTEADMNKVREVAAYTKSFYSLEDGIEDYVKNYLGEESIW